MNILESTSLHVIVTAVISISTMRTTFYILVVAVIISIFTKACMLLRALSGEEAGNALEPAEGATPDGCTNKESAACQRHTQSLHQIKNDAGGRDNVG